MIKTTIWLMSAIAGAGLLAFAGSGESRASEGTPKKVTYSGQIAPILQKHCMRCHRDGETAPFSLTSYEDAKKRAKMIALVTGTRQMPPWKAVEGHGEFHDVNRLTDEQIADLKAWAADGAPLGDAKKVPKNPSFPAGWQLGQPDMVLQMEKPFRVGAEGKDQYRHFVIDPKLKEPVYVQAIDVHPGNRKAVHHVIMYVDYQGRADKLVAKNKDGQDGYDSFGSPGFMPDTALGGWAPGLMARRLPEGAGIELKPGAKIVMEVHYHRTGKEEVDQTKVGLYVAPKPAIDKVQLAWMFNFNLKLTAGDPRIVVRKTVPIGADIVVYNVMPHMHLLGKSMKATIELPDGTMKPMVFVDDWDFNWQMSYSYKEPMKIPKGSKVHIEAVYDNSSGNPRNPNNPPKNVHWGEQTTDEMFLLIAAVALDRNPAKTGR